MVDGMTSLLSIYRLSFFFFLLDTLAFFLANHLFYAEPPFKGQVSILQL